MSSIKRINLPVSNDIRLRGLKGQGVDGADLWVAAGPSTAIAEAVQAGGVHVMTRRGPRVILVDRVVKLADGLAIVPIEPDFDDVKTTKVATVEDMTVDQLKAALAAAESKGAAKVTSSGRNGGRKGATAKPTTSKPTTVAQSAPAATAVQDVDDDDLAELLVTT